MPTTIEIFCCYAREDQDLMKSLRKHLMPLQREGLITFWSDTDIDAGMVWGVEMKKHLDTAPIILLLISPDFMASDYCYNVEMEHALERSATGEARVIPILLRPVQRDGTPISQLQALPTNGKPITSWRKSDEAFQNVADGIRQVVINYQKMKEKSVPANAGSVVLNIPLQRKDLEPDFSNLKKTRWYRRDLKELSIHIDNHDFCTKVIDIKTKTVQDIETYGITPPNLRDSLLRQIERSSESFPLWLPLYWENLSDLLARSAIEMFASFGNNLSAFEIALKSMKHTLEHAHYQLAFYLSSAIFPNYAEKFGFPDIAAYLRKYEEYTNDLSFGMERAIAKIYLEKDYDKETQPENYLIDTVLVGSKSRQVSGQRIYLPQSLGINIGDLQLLPEVEQVIDRYSWYILCLPQILIRILSLVTLEEGLTIKEIVESGYKPGLNMDDYEMIGNP